MHSCTFVCSLDENQLLLSLTLMDGPVDSSDLRATKPSAWPYVRHHGTITFAETCGNGRDSLLCNSFLMRPAMSM